MCRHGGLAARDADPVIVDQPEQDAAGPGGRHDRAGSSRCADDDGVEELLVLEHEPRTTQARGQLERSARGRGARCRAGRRPRGTRRTWRPRRRAAPARCRCSRSPSRAGCAARASAAPAGRQGRSSASTESPTRRPGRSRSSPAFTAMNAACGPPYQSGTPKRCDDPTTTSAPHSPGGLSSVRARRSAATVTMAPRCVCVLRQSGEVTDGARAPGVLLHHAEVVALGQPGGRDRPRRPEPRAERARVSRMAIVCGRQSASTTTRCVLDGGATTHEGDGLGHRRPLVQQ